MMSKQLGMQENAAMYSNANVWLQTFDCCCIPDQASCFIGEIKPNTKKDRLISLMRVDNHIKDLIRYRPRTSWSRQVVCNGCKTQTAVAVAERLCKTLLEIKVEKPSSCTTKAAVICGCHPWAKDAHTAVVTTGLHSPPHQVCPAPPVTAASYGM